MVGDKVNKKKTNPILSEQELRVLKFICRDFSYKQIAEEMDLSIKTVETYRVSLFDKLNVKSRVGLVMYAVKNGIITTWLNCIQDHSILLTKRNQSYTSCKRI